MPEGQDFFKNIKATQSPLNSQENIEKEGFLGEKIVKAIEEVKTVTENLKFSEVEKVLDEKFSFEQVCPKAIFKGEKEEIVNAYNEMMFSCKAILKDIMDGKVVMQNKWDSWDEGNRINLDIMANDISKNIEMNDISLSSLGLDIEKIKEAVKKRKAEKYKIPEEVLEDGINLRDHHDKRKLEEKPFNVFMVLSNQLTVKKWAVKSNIPIGEAYSELSKYQRENKTEMPSTPEFTINKQFCEIINKELNKERESHLNEKRRDTFELFLRKVNPNIEQAYKKLEDLQSVSTESIITQWKNEMKNSGLKVWKIEKRQVISQPKHSGDPVNLKLEINLEISKEKDEENNSKELGLALEFDYNKGDYFLAQDYTYVPEEDYGFDLEVINQLRNIPLSQFTGKQILEYVNSYKHGNIFQAFREASSSENFEGKE